MTGLRELLTIRDFRYLWLAQAGSDFGDNLTFLTLLILTQRLTGSTVALAGLTIAIALPSVVFGMVSGVYADRFNRKTTMVVSDVLRGVLVLGFLFVRSEELVPLMYAIGFVQASIGTLFNPSRGALLPRIVGEERLLAANSVSQTSRVVFNVLGTTAAGVLAAVSSTLALAFVVDSATFLFSALMIWRIRTHGGVEQGQVSEMWAGMKEGLAILVSSRPLQAVLLGAALAMLGLGAVNVLIVPLLIDELGVSEAFFGLVEAGQVTGMVLSGGLVAVLAQRLKASSLVSGGLVGLGVAISAVAFIQAGWHMAFVGFAVGFMLSPVNGGVGTLTQTLVSDQMRGRVGGALNAIIATATVVSMGLAGVGAASFGVRNVFLIAGGMSVLGGIAAALMFQRGATPDTEFATVAEST